MSESTALRLADALEAWTLGKPTHHREAAAELRRLHGLDFALRDCELALQKMATKYMDAVDQRDALLEALKRIADPRNIHFAGDAQVVARAAITKAEGEAK
jgi:hypothetical protein